MPITEIMLSEMLGNQYFLSRKYENAVQNFQYVLESNPLNKPIRKKLIICYSQIGQIKKAFEFFYSLIKEDADIIINTDIVADDCPCPELVAKYGGVFPYEKESTDLKLMLGMLWLYCDINKSLGFFKALAEENDSDQRIKEIISLLEMKAKSLNKNSNKKRGDTDEKN